MTCNSYPVYRYGTEILGEDAPIERAVKECIDKGILANYLKRKVR